MMAVDLQGSELLLPSQLFSEDNKNKAFSMNCSKGSSLVGVSDFGSELGSPVQSELGSTETEESSEAEAEDCYIAELTRQMAHYMLLDEDKNEKPWGFAGSPQSTLWSLSGSSHGSPRGPSRESSPPVIPMIANLEKVKINEEILRYSHCEGYLSTPSSVPVTTRNPKGGFQSKQVLIDQVRATQFYRLKQEQALKESDYRQQPQYYENKGKAFGGFNNGQKLRPHHGPCSTLQQQQGNNSSKQTESGMRAVFLGGSGSRTGSGGTGVFLPRGIGTPSESRKKTGYPTVLIPARVVQALKLHFDKMGLPSRFDSGFTLQNDALMVERRRSSSFSQQQGTLGVTHQELHLPQEWTY